MVAVDFDARTIKRGFGAGQSSLICDDEITTPGAAVLDEEKEQILEFVHDALIQQMSQVKVVDGATIAIDDMNVHRIVLVNSSEELGCAGGSASTFTGFVSDDVGNASHHDVGFVVVKEEDSLGDIASHIADVAIYEFGRAPSQSARLNLAEESGAPAMQPADPMAILAGFATLLKEMDPKAKIDISPLMAQVDQAFPGGLGGITPANASLAQLPKVGGLQDLDKIIGAFAIAAEAAANGNKAIDLSNSTSTKLCASWRV